VVTPFGATSLRGRYGVTLAKVLAAPSWPTSAAALELAAAALLSLTVAAELAATRRSSAAAS